MLEKRLQLQKNSCLFASNNTCCRICSLGPCKIIDKKEISYGVCGADKNLIISRNIARSICAGVAAHTDHALDLLEKVKNKNINENTYNKQFLSFIFKVFKSKNINKILQTIEKDLSRSSEKEIKTLTFYKNHLLVLEKNIKNIINFPFSYLPKNPKSEIVEVLHRTHFGNDANYKSIILNSFRLALSDALISSFYASILSDLYFGSTNIREIYVDYGVLDPKAINIVTHGHEPIFIKKLFEFLHSDEGKDFLKKYNFPKINIIGMCCSGNELLGKFGINVVGHIMDSEKVLTTNLVDIIFVDVQCILPSLEEICKKHEIQMIPTNKKANFKYFDYVEFNKENIKNILLKALKRYKARKIKSVPFEKIKIKAGYKIYTLENIFDKNFEKLLKDIENNKVNGLAIFVGCSNPKVNTLNYLLDIVDFLLNKGIIIFTTGCSAITLSKFGLTMGEKNHIYHMGSCVDTSQFVYLYLYLKSKIKNLKAVAFAPEWITEKAMAIASYFVALGIPTFISPPLPVDENSEFYSFIGNLKSILGATFINILDLHEIKHELSLIFNRN